MLKDALSVCAKYVGILRIFREPYIEQILKIFSTVQNWIVANKKKTTNKILELFQSYKSRILRFNLEWFKQKKVSFN